MSSSMKVDDEKTLIDLVISFQLMSITTVFQNELKNCRILSLTDYRGN